MIKHTFVIPRIFPDIQKPDRMMALPPDSLENLEELDALQIAVTYDLNWLSRGKAATILHSASTTGMAAIHTHINTVKAFDIMNEDVDDRQLFPCSILNYYESPQTQPPTKQSLAGMTVKEEEDTLEVSSCEPQPNTIGSDILEYIKECTPPRSNHLREDLEYLFKGLEDIPLDLYD